MKFKVLHECLKMQFLVCCILDYLSFLLYTSIVLFFFSYLIYFIFAMYHFELRNSLRKNTILVNCINNMLAIEIRFSSSSSYKNYTLSA